MERIVERVNELDNSIQVVHERLVTERTIGLSKQTKDELQVIIDALLDRRNELTTSGDRG